MDLDPNVKYLIDMSYDETTYERQHTVAILMVSFLNFANRWTRPRSCMPTG